MSKKMHMQECTRTSCSDGCASCAQTLACAACMRVPARELGNNREWPGTMLAARFRTRLWDPTICLDTLACCSPHASHCASSLIATTESPPCFTVLASMLHSFTVLTASNPYTCTKTHTPLTVHNTAPLTLCLSRWPRVYNHITVYVAPYSYTTVAAHMHMHPCSWSDVDIHTHARAQRRVAPHHTTPPTHASVVLITLVLQICAGLDVRS
jgi:hypothetical protein